MHTPGPWHLINDVCVGGPIEPGWEEAGCGIAHCGMRARTQKEAAANARLIAAAPDLAVALDNLVVALEMPGDHCETDNAMRQAKAALAKVRGKTTT